MSSSATRRMRTPRSFTSEPRFSPWVDSSKYTTKRSGLAKKLIPPNESSAMMPSANAPITNAPTMDGLTLVFMADSWAGRILRSAQNDRTNLSDASWLRQQVPSAQKFRHARIAAVHGQFARRALGDDPLGHPVQHDNPVRETEDRRQLVRHDHDGGAEGVTNLPDELIELPRSHRI